MKKTAVLAMAVMLVFIASTAMADHKWGWKDWHGKHLFHKDWKSGKVAQLYLFQKCDESLYEQYPDLYDAAGCPLPGNGPWPIYPDERRWGQMQYNLWGEKFVFSFQGKKLVPKTAYTLIYYPDPWPGEGLICLGSGKTNPAGNIAIHGKKEILVGDPVDPTLSVHSGLPAGYDANFNPAPGSGAVGAKIWLVKSDDVSCVDGETKMLNWNPADYLFEANMIVYQYAPAPVKTK